MQWAIFCENDFPIIFTVIEGCFNQENWKNIKKLKKKKNPEKLQKLLKIINLIIYCQYLNFSGFFQSSENEFIFLISFFNK